MKVPRIYGTVNQQRKVVTTWPRYWIGIEEPWRAKMMFAYPPQWCATKIALSRLTWLANAVNVRICNSNVIASR